MSDTPRGDALEELPAELLDLLREGDAEPEPPEHLADNAIRHVRASITARDMIDLATIVFLLKFCAPLIDLIVAIVGEAQRPVSENRSESHE